MTSHVGNLQYRLVSSAIYSEVICSVMRVLWIVMSTFLSDLVKISYSKVVEVVLNRRLLPVPVFSILYLVISKCYQVC